jgi:ribonuclease BN (tRNA processing enzyme)
VKLTVVGSSPAWPNPGSAHSGYLVHGEGTLLLDCGPGVLGKLRAGGGWPQVDAIAITHWHLDHWGDLVPWVWGRAFGEGIGGTAPELWVPPGGIAMLRHFGSRFGTETMFDSAFSISEYSEATAFATAAGLEVTAIEVPHYTVDAYAFRVTDGARMLAYSGDSAPTEQLVVVARGADIFLCEATLAVDDPDGNPRGHLCEREALAAFEQSGAAQLVITHRPVELPVSPGVEVARDGLELEV